MRRLTWLLALAAVAQILDGQVKAGYTTIAPPGATSASAASVSGGNVVGFYETSDGSQLGFLYQSVPEPSGLVLLGIGFAATAGYLVLRRRMPSSTPVRIPHWVQQLVGAGQNRDGGRYWPVGRDGRPGR